MKSNICASVRKVSHSFGRRKQSTISDSGLRSIGSIAIHDIRRQRQRRRRRRNSKSELHSWSFQFSQFAHCLGAPLQATCWFLKVLEERGTPTSASMQRKHPKAPLRPVSGPCGKIDPCQGSFPRVPASETPRIFSIRL